MESVSQSVSQSVVSLCRAGELPGYAHPGKQWLSHLLLTEPINNTDITLHTWTFPFIFC